DTGSGDFSERLLRLTDRIVDRFGKSSFPNGNIHTSSQVLEIVYGTEIRAMRDEVLSYLKVKGNLFLLFDNIDRFWTPAGFDATDSLIISGLVESLQEIKKRFAREHVNFVWAVFVRSDVYEFVVKGMADYGKMAVGTTEWNDRALLQRMFERRVMSGLQDEKLSWREICERVSVQQVNGTPTMDFLIDSCLMRPRYLIRLFENARQRAVTFERAQIEAEDYAKALEELAWQVLEDFDRELVDIVPSAHDLIFDLVQIGPSFSLSELREAIARRVTGSPIVE